MKQLYETIFDRTLGGDSEVDVVLTSIVGDHYNLWDGGVTIDVRDLILDPKKWAVITQCLKKHKLICSLHNYCYISLGDVDCVGGKTVPEYIIANPAQLMVMGGRNFSNIHIEVIGDSCLFTGFDANTPPKFKNVKVDLKKSDDQCNKNILINCENPQGIDMSGIESNYNALTIKPEFIKNNPYKNWEKFEKSILSNISVFHSTYECDIEVSKFFKIPSSVEIIKLQLPYGCFFEKIWFVKKQSDVSGNDRRSYNRQTRNEGVPTSKDGWFVYAIR